MNVLKKIIVLVFVFTSTITFSQESNLGNWMIYLGNKKLNDQWNLHHEVQYRNYNALGDLEQLLLRAGLGFNLTPSNNNVLAGYAFIQSSNYIPNTDNKINSSEHRIYQQFITKQSIGRVNIQHRYRFEQRWSNDNFKMRLRYFLAANLPLNHSVMEDGTLYLSAYNEVFINTKNTLFDRNRLYGGLGYQLNSHMKFEVGYMNQRFNVGSRDQINLIANISF